ncbi:hypothetical protein CEXT_473821 [Caerostris extrusa]|uniref:Uncharacterized protein n=1 Tax=Caerostris extrusa TaxID=172846 RepID=A0AAV4UMP8_CAEEX|nr:hypothetical protein CEXT_473821 [Caerostris extrusa]
MEIRQCNGHCCRKSRCLLNLRFGLGSPREVETELHVITLEESATCVNCVCRSPSDFLRQYDCRTITTRSGSYYGNTYSSCYHGNNGKGQSYNPSSRRDEATPRVVTLQTPYSNGLTHLLPNNNSAEVIRLSFT